MRIRLRAGADCEVVKALGYASPTLVRAVWRPSTNPSSTGAAGHHISTSAAEPPAPVAQRVKSAAWRGELLPRECVSEIAPCDQSAIKAIGLGICAPQPRGWREDAARGRPIHRTAASIGRGVDSASIRASAGLPTGFGGGLRTSQRTVATARVPAVRVDAAATRACTSEVRDVERACMLL